MHIYNFFHAFYDSSYIMTSYKEIIFYYKNRLEEYKYELLVHKIKFSNLQNKDTY